MRSLLPFGAKPAPPQGDLRDTRLTQPAMLLHAAMALAVLEVRAAGGMV